MKVLNKVLVWLVAVGGFALLTGCGSDAPQPLYLDDPDEESVDYPTELPDAAPPAMQPAPVIPVPDAEEDETPETGILEWTPAEE